MTTVQERPPRTATPPPGRRVVRVLALREARWIVRHPLFLLGIAGTIALAWLTTAWWHAPVMHRDDTRLAGCMLPLAGATMIVCNLAAFRARRHGTEDIEDAAATPRSRRTAAHLAAFFAPLLVALLLAAAYVAFLAALGGIWKPSAQELATGPAIVALAAAAGIALARWVPSPIAGTVGLLALGALQIRGWEPNGNLRYIWFAPFVDGGNENRIREMSFRPAGWHLLYLLGAAGVFAAAASLRHGRKPRRMAMLAVALSILLLGGVMQSRPIDRAELAKMVALVKDPATGQTCETRGAVTYCVFPAYRPWIDRWDPTVQRVLAPLPAADRPVITIRQAFDPQELYWLGLEDELPGHAAKADGVEPPAYFETTEDIVLRAAWARGADESGASFDLALAVARRVIGVTERRVSEERRYTADQIAPFKKHGWPGQERGEPMPAVGDTYTQQGTCWTAGQAREAIALWLAARAVPGSVALLDNPPGESVYASFGDDPTIDGYFADSFTEHGSNFVVSGYAVAWTPAGIRTAVEMSSRLSDAVVTSTLTRDWRSWINSTTALERLQSAFGLRKAQPATPGWWLPPACP